MYARPSHGTARSRPAPPARSADNSPSLSHQERAEPAEPGDRRPTAEPLLGGPRLFADEDGEARGRRAAPESEPPATLLRRRDDRREDGLASATGIRRAIKCLLERSRTGAKALPTQQQRLPDLSAATNEPGDLLREATRRVTVLPYAEPKASAENVVLPHDQSPQWPRANDIALNACSSADRRGAVASRC